MYRELLPIGSVVLLKGANKRLMIVGRVVAHDDDQISDYVGCYYPQGVIDSNNLFFFGQDSIDTVYFIGFQDQEEIGFRNNVLSQLDEGEVVVRDGQITVIKE